MLSARMTSDFPEERNKEHRLEAYATRRSQASGLCHLDHASKPWTQSPEKPAKPKDPWPH